MTRLTEEPQSLRTISTMELFIISIRFEGEAGPRPASPESRIDSGRRAEGLQYG